MLKIVERRVEEEKPAAVKIRWDGDRTTQDADIPGDIAKAKAVRKLLGDDFVLGFDANNLYSVGGAIRVGRALEDLGFAWFEEPVQHYHVARNGRGRAEAGYPRLGRRADLHPAGAQGPDQRRGPDGPARYRSRWAASPG